MHHNTDPFYLNPTPVRSSVVEIRQGTMLYEKDPLDDLTISLESDINHGLPAPFLSG